MAAQTLSASLLKEGKLMLQALLNELKLLPHITPIVLLDSRCELAEIPVNTKIIRVDTNSNIQTILASQLLQCDAFWPIAPETDGILEGLQEMAAAAKKTAFISSLETLTICKSKYQTAICLERQGLSVIPTQRLCSGFRFDSGPLVIKLDDGVGCEDSHIIRQADDLTRMRTKLKYPPERYIVQPLLEGSAVSLSCLYSHGKGWLICCNRQHISFEGHQLSLYECVVNESLPLSGLFRQLINNIAVALPGLWGYVGIDLIVTDNGKIIVVEINPRLTTSYAGIHAATGINVAKQVLNLDSMPPDLTPTQNQTVTIHLNKEIH